MLSLPSPAVQCLMESCTVVSSAGSYHTLLWTFVGGGLIFLFAKVHSSIIKGSTPGDAKVIFTLGCSDAWAPPQPDEIMHSKMQAILVLRGSTYWQMRKLLADATQSVPDCVHSSLLQHGILGCLLFLFAPQNYKCQALGAACHRSLIWY